MHYALSHKLFSNLIWHFPRNAKKIYLTFDDGPHPEITSWVLEQLKAYNAMATFFCIGKNIEKYPEMVEKIIAEDHHAGNHTYNHLNGWKVSKSKYIEDVETCHSLLTSNFKHQTLNFLFRPPYGKITPAQYSIIVKKYSIILWDVLSHDYDTTYSGRQCYERIIKKTKPGSAIVFHDSEKASENLRYALPRILEFYSKKGFVFSSIK